MADRGPLLRYVAGWLAAGSVLVVLVFTLLPREGGDEVPLPPVRQTELSEAARAAGCELRAQGRRPILRPAVSGPRGTAARPGVYSRMVDPRALIGAVRVGTIVIHHRPALGDGTLDRLRTIQRAVPAGTILAPQADMPYLVAVTGWRRLLGCRRVDAATFDAIRLFRGRFIGSGPDR